MSRVLAVLFVTLISTQSLAATDLERRAVVWMEGCTGFIVEPGLLLTAKHCGAQKSVTVTIDGQQVEASLAQVGAGKDGPLVYLLPAGDWRAFALSDTVPQVGDAVYSLGYPGGHFAKIAGVITGGNGVDQNQTEMRINPGHSGGPLLNANGQVIGVATAVATDLATNRSFFVGWRKTREACLAAIAAGAKDAQSSSPRESGRHAVDTSRADIVVFASRNCPACRILKHDVDSGAFAAYRFSWVYWDAALGAWSDSDLYREFMERCQPESDSLAFPTIWIRGTDHYRVGYATSMQKGLLQWIEVGARIIIEAIIGGPERPKFPTPESSGIKSPEAGVPPASQVPTPVPDDPPAPAPYSRDLESEIVGLKRQVSQLAADSRDAVKIGKDFADAGLIGKAVRLKSILGVKDSLTDDVMSLRNQVSDLKEQTTADPAGALWGLLGIVTGLLHRRFAA